MTLVRSTACLAASLFMLAACSKPPAAGESEAATPQAATPASNPASQASATSDTTMPDMKAGLWEIKINHVGGDGQAHGGVTQQCLDSAAMAQAKVTAADYLKANCSKNKTQRAGDTWTNDLVCKSGGSIMTTHTVTAMVGDGAYHTDLSTTFDPPVAGNANSTTTMDGKWISACKPT
jgi:Protein of unknown function (DUF3617)